MMKPTVLLRDGHVALGQRAAQLVAPEAGTPLDAGRLLGDAAPLARQKLVAAPIPESNEKQCEAIGEMRNRKEKQKETM